MKVNFKKIDERIQKLQEIKRIAADPEFVAMLFEFIADDDRAEAPPVAKPLAVAAGRPSDIDIVNQVMNGMDHGVGTHLKRT
jgi:hypothetical protein